MTARSTSENPFFSGTPQKDIKIRQFSAKSPVFYPNLEFMLGVFSGDLKAIRDFLPNSNYQPIRLSPHRGLVAIHCFEYKDSDVGPYNEISLSFPIQYGRPTYFPTQAALVKSILTDQYHAYVKELPVSTEISLYGGLDYFNYPKYLADITFRESAHHRVCTLRDPQTLDLIFEFEGRKLQTSGAQPRTMTLNSYPEKDGQAWRARVAMNIFASSTSYLPAPLSLCSTRLGEHSRSTPFEKLKLGSPLMYLYVPQAEAILFEPELL